MIKRLIVPVCIVILALSCKPVNKGFETITFSPDTTTVYKNPCMGWVMYSEGWELYPHFQEKFDRVNVKSFWQEMDAVKADEVSNILYIRALWSAFEPEEGQYAWEHDPHFIEFVEGAKKRNLKLAFRVFHDSRDMVQQATPEYVFEAGADYQLVDCDNGKVKNPYFDDPVFLNKFGAFVKAFGERFDNPDEVDFIDGYGAGRWGEGHGVSLKDSKNLLYVIDQITAFYAASFKKVLLVYNLSTGDFLLAKDLVYEKRKFLARRDGLGSHWFGQKEKELVKQYFFPNSPLIGEGCYWLNDPTGEKQGNWYENDKAYTMNSWPEALAKGVDDALTFHSNTFDLRVPLQAKMWIEECPLAVQRFIAQGGYRLFPSQIDVEQNNRYLNLKHTWENYGVGLLPNNNPQWNYKYGLSFALLDENKQTSYQVRIEDAEPSTWIKGKPLTYISSLSIPATLAKGKYTLAVGITNRDKNELPDVNIAVDQRYKVNKWVKIKTIEID
ncbi:MAG: DUF4832 domain-containing protein [Carboxylicivirga sp.]|nr:DUF4832 domain-containing protein [Carboxylicivirga sp.]